MKEGKEEEWKTETKYIIPNIKMAPIEYAEGLGRNGFIYYQLFLVTVDMDPAIGMYCIIPKKRVTVDPRWCSIWLVWIFSKF